MAALILVAGLVGVVIHGWNIHGDPDPGGQIMTVLKSVESAVPPNATDVSRRYDQAVWDSCDGRPGTSGWTQIMVTLTFRSTRLPNAVVSWVIDHLQTSGWPLRPVTLPPGAVSSGVPVDAGLWFQRTLANGAKASALLSEQTRDGSANSWLLTATAPPDGPVASGC
jgi:hypothetical protein